MMFPVLFLALTSVQCSENIEMVVTKSSEMMSEEQTHDVTGKLVKQLDQQWKATIPTDLPKEGYGRVISLEEEQQFGGPLIEEEITLLLEEYFGEDEGFCNPLMHCLWIFTLGLVCFIAYSLKVELT